MAYMHEPVYVWSDGEQMHIGSLVMTQDIFDALVAMRWHQMSPDEQTAAEELALERYSGNLSIAGIQRSRGLPTIYDEIHKSLKSEFRQKKETDG